MKKILIVLAAALVLAAGFWFLKIRNGDKSGLPKFETARVERGDLKETVLSTGTIQPYTRVEVKPSGRGRVEQVQVREGDRVRTGAVLALISSEERIALLDAARAALEASRREPDPAAAADAQASLKLAEQSYRPVPLTASIAGEVIKRAAEPGQNVSAEDILFVISDRLVASVEVDESDIGQIRLGRKARIRLDAYPDQVAEGRVIQISRESRVESDVVVYDVIVEVPRVPPFWASGMTANVEFIIAEKTGVLVIPKTALKKRGGRTEVLVPAEAGFAPRPPLPVETGITDGKMVEITAGLAEGETIVVGESSGGVKEEKKKGTLRMMGPPPR
jgi:macrolide-specific efflux system membrane fusion protein